MVSCRSQAGAGSDQGKQMKQAIAIDLDQLKLLLKEFIAERGGDDDLLQQLLLSDFLAWMREKIKGEVNGKQSLESVH